MKIINKKLIKILGVSSLSLMLIACGDSESVDKKGKSYSNKLTEVVDGEKIPSKFEEKFELDYIKEKMAFDFNKNYILEYDVFFDGKSISTDTAYTSLYSELEVKKSGEDVKEVYIETYLEDKGQVLVDIVTSFDGEYFKNKNALTKLEELYDNFTQEDVNDNFADKSYYTSIAAVKDSKEILEGKYALVFKNGTKTFTETEDEYTVFYESEVNHTVYKGKIKVVGNVTYDKDFNLKMVKFVAGAEDKIFSNYEYTVE